MGISDRIDAMIGDLKRRKLKPEHVVMGKHLCMAWLVEQSSKGGGLTLQKAKSFRFSHKGIPVIVCESEILEVVPNARHLLGDAG